MIQTHEQERDWIERLGMMERATEPEYGRFRNGLTVMFEVYLLPNGLTVVFDNEGHQLGMFQGRIDQVLDLIRNFKNADTLFYDDQKLVSRTWKEFAEKWG